MTGVFVESVTFVEPLSGCEFELVFNTGEKRVLDTVPYLGRGMLPSAVTVSLFFSEFRQKSREH